jgi:membrane-anchored mycosin MYCP
MTRTGAAAAGGVLALAFALGAGTAVRAAVPGPARAGARAPECAGPGQPYQPVPWAQQMLAPERVWPFTRGFGITVAVLDSGVDGRHPRLKGRVAAGFDALAPKGGPANSDCLGTGTQVAGVIAADRAAEIGFVGLAPLSTILPVRVLAGDGFGPPSVRPDVLARGIVWAVENGADVIDVAAPTYTDDPGVRAAVARARDKGVLIVAAVGELDGAGGGERTPYPAAYPGVLGVGAIDQGGNRWSQSAAGDYVDLVAPGVAVTSLQARGGMVAEANGTGIASGFVAATAALARARRGTSLDSREIVQLLVSTAAPAPLGPRSPQYGYGIVNPYAVVNDFAADAAPAPLPGLPRPASRSDQAWTRSRSLAVAGATGTAGLVVLVLVAAVALPRGRRRLWRPALAPPLPHPAGPDDPDDARPPVGLFDPAPPGDRSEHSARAG